MIDKILYWHNGLFLKPHHFQYLQISIENLKNNLLIKNKKYYWGISEVVIDDIKLSSNEIQIKSGEFIFKDGTICNYPKNSILNSRNIGEKFKNKNILKCFLGLKKIDIYQSNVFEITELDKSSKDNRFILNRDKTVTQNNLFENDDKADLLFLDYNLKIFFEDELDSYLEYEFLPLIELVKINEEILISKKYIPPYVTLNNSIINILNEIYNTLFSHLSRFEDFKYQANYNSSNDELSKHLQILSLFSENLVDLENYVTNEHAHPHEVYLFLKKLATKLASFSSKANILLEGTDKSSLLKKYDHNNLFNIFDDLKKLISNLLEEISIEVFDILEFNNSDGIYVIDNIKIDYFDNNYDFYISFEKDFYSKINFIKLESKEKIFDIINSSLPGLSFNKIDNFPIKSLKNADNVYIKLNKNTQNWFNIRKSSNLALFIDDLFEIIKIKLIVVKSKDEQ